MLDLTRLRLLDEFARRGSIAETAVALGYSASAVSQHLDETWIAAPPEEPSRQALDRLLHDPRAPQPRPRRIQWEPAAAVVLSTDEYPSRRADRCTPSR